MHKCSNISCGDTIIEEHRELTEVEKKYGILCTYCRTVIKDVKKLTKVICVNCDKIVKLATMKQKTDTTYVIGCRNCGNQELEENTMSVN